MKRLERQHGCNSSKHVDSETPDTSSGEVSREAHATIDEVDVMHSVACSFVQMRERLNHDIRSTCDDEHCGSSSEEEFVAASALQLQLQRSAERPQRLQELPLSIAQGSHRSATPTDNTKRKATQCVSGGGNRNQRGMLERDGNSRVTDRQQKRGCFSSSADARILIR